LLETLRYAGWLKNCLLGQFVTPWP
jgi:hypothetical protein